jgi:hypothetical protein
MAILIASNIAIKIKIKIKRKERKKTFVLVFWSVTKSKKESLHPKFLECHKQVQRLFSSTLITRLYLSLYIFSLILSTDLTQGRSASHKIKVKLSGQIRLYNYKRSILTQLVSFSNHSKICFNSSNVIFFN